jgi:hypothetical protein
MGCAPSRRSIWLFLSLPDVDGRYRGLRRALNARYQGRQPQSISMRTTAIVEARHVGSAYTHHSRSQGVTRAFRPDFARPESSAATIQARLRHDEKWIGLYLLILNDLLWRRGWDSCRVAMSEANRPMPEDHPSRHRASASE